MKVFSSIFLANRFFYCVAAVVVLYVAGFYSAVFMYLGHMGILTVLSITVYEVIILVRTPKPLRAERILPEIVSLNDEFTIVITTQNTSSRLMHIELYDEPPYQTDLRTLCFHFPLQPGEKARSEYKIQPKERGAFEWGNLNYFLCTKIGFVKRKWIVPNEVEVKVLPSIIQMRKAELMAVNPNAVVPELKKMRKIGDSMEFEQIRSYVRGDDYRRINWKATSRQHDLRINTYRDERSQSVYSVIDTSRNMAGMFEGMSLMDYAVNAALAISNAALKKEDNAGLITFAEQTDRIITASGRRTQLNAILNALYAQKNSDLEADFEHLFTSVKRRVKHRSLLLVYTNFDHVSSLERSLSALRSLAQKHVVVVVIFENVSIKEVTEKEVHSIKEVYTRTVAEHHVLEKNLIINELRNFGIQTVLTSPEKLTINTLNKYLELKARRLI